MKNKKIKLVCLLGTLGLIGVGGTYAWLTTSVTAAQVVSMGELKLEADFEELSDSVNYEPGLDLTFTGMIKNSGSIEAIAKVENNSEVMLKYKNNQLDPATSPKFLPDKENAVTIDFKPNTTEGSYWLKDGHGNAYVLFEVGGSTETEIYSLLNGDVMGNKYQNSQLKVGVKLKATQVLDDAMLAEFGITSADLTNYTSQAKLKNQMDGKTRLLELVNR